MAHMHITEAFANVTKTGHAPVNKGIPRSALRLPQMPALANRRNKMQWDAALDGHQIVDFFGTNEAKAFIDFTSGIFTASVGHQNKHVLKSIMRQCVNGILNNHGYKSQIHDDYIKKLCAFTGYEDARLFSAGCEAVEAAIRIIHKHGSVFGYPGAMHGKTLGARLIMRDGYILAPNIMSNDALGGYLFETYQGWDCKFINKEWLKISVDELNNNKVIVCFDEIQAGFGRTGKLFGFEHYDLPFKPDLVCIGKGMGNGFPLSGLLGSKELLNTIDDLHSTYSGNPLACAAGIAVIEEFERLDLINESARKGHILFDELHIELGSIPNVINWNGGLVAAILTDTKEQADEICQKCEEKGLLVVNTGKASVKIGPPLTIPDDALIEGCRIIREVINAVVLLG